MKRIASADSLAGRAAAPAARRLHCASSTHLSLRLSALRLRMRVGLPDELWGAASLALRMGRGGPERSRSQAVLAQAFSAGAVAPPPTPQELSQDAPKSVAEALAFQPALSPRQQLLSLAAPALACMVAYCFTAPPSVQLGYSTGMALLYALLVLAARSWLLERQYAAVQRSELELAGAGARYLDLGGCQVHYTARTARSLPSHPAAAAPPGAPRLGVHCLHGFGASSFSWASVQSELARALGAVVTAHDMPGFGLTARPRSGRFYTLAFNGQAARAVMDAELAGAAGGQAPAGSEERAREEGGAGGAGGAPPSPPPRRVLVGHSMGGAAAAEGVIAEPEGVEALVLVAPAIVALWTGPPEEARGDVVATGLSVVEELVGPEDALGVLSSADSSASQLDLSPASEDAGGAAGEGAADGAAARAAPGRPPSPSAADGAPPRLRRGATSQWLRRAARTGGALLQAAAFSAIQLVLRVCSPLLVLLLRHVVRQRSFWERGLLAAWHRKAGVTAEVVDGYRLGLLVRGWEHGILRFLSGRFAEKEGLWGAVVHAVRGDGRLTQAERLARVVRRHGIRVLIVHGAQDALVPLANSRRLARLLPGARLAVFDACGHMPQEECPDAFVAQVAAFVRGEAAPPAGGV